MSDYPADTEVPWFRSRVKCAKCGGRGNKIDVRPSGKSGRRAEEPDREGVAIEGFFYGFDLILFLIVFVTIARFLWAML